MAWTGVRQARPIHRWCSACIHSESDGAYVLPGHCPSRQKGQCKDQAQHTHSACYSDHVYDRIRIHFSHTALRASGNYEQHH